MRTHAAALGATHVPGLREKRFLENTRDSDLVLDNLLLPGSACWLCGEPVGAELSSFESRLLPPISRSQAEIVAQASRSCT